MQSLLNLIKDIHLHCEGSGGPLNCFNQGNDNPILALKENRLEEGQIEGEESSRGAGGFIQDGEDGAWTR